MSWPYSFRANKHGQLLPCRIGEEHLPHINVSWYLTGMWEGGTAAVLPGETREQAAQRAYGDRARKTELCISDVEWQVEQ